MKKVNLLFLLISSFLTIPCFIFFVFLFEVFCSYSKLSLNPTEQGFIQGCFVGICFSFWFYIFKYSSELEEKRKEVENIKKNRDIPEIIKIEEEKWAIKKEQEQARLNEQIKNGEYSLHLSLKTLEQVTRGLKHDKLTLTIKQNKIEIHDGMQSYTISPTVDKNKGVASYWHDISAFDECITRRIDKKEFISALKAIPTPYVEIQFSKNNQQIQFNEPRGSATVTIIAKN